MNLTPPGSEDMTAGIGPAASGYSVPAVTKSEAVYLEVRRRILFGDIKPGTVVGQVALAKTLAVSTTPLREALRRLESEHLVTSTAHKEVWISPLTVSEVTDLYQVRLVLDPLAGNLAAKNATDADIETVAAFLERIRASTGDELVTANRAFHRAIYRACGNTVLIESLDSLWDRSDRYRTILVSHESQRPTAESEHAEMLEALQRRQGRLLEKTIREHLRESMDAIIRLGAKELIEGGAPGS